MNRIKHRIKQATLVLILSFAVAGCFESSSDDLHSTVDVGDNGGGAPIGSSANGKIYYTSNCSSCHAAGADDITTAFGSSDLRQKQDLIVNDMSAFDPTNKMMTQLNNVSQQRVDDLMAYLATL
ncbi:MAG: cytochrome c [Acidiferrobacterales bacterium]